MELPGGGSVAVVVGIAVAVTVAAALAVAVCFIGFGATIHTRQEIPRSLVCGIFFYELYAL